MGGTWQKLIGDWERRLENGESAEEILASRKEHRTIATFIKNTCRLYWVDGKWVCWDGSVPPADWELPPPPESKP